MTKVLGHLQPEKVFHYFEEISNIPRGSGNEQAISDYMVAFAKKHGLEVKQDEAKNIYITKPATPGYEDAPGVILQGHMDMVCEKNKDTEHDFEKEGLKLYIDGDFIRAKGTTLGADNGVAIAYQMAILADNTLKHPMIEALMTTEEETGMGGVEALHPEYLQGKRMINLDTDIEGEFLVSCAGGAKTLMELPVKRVEATEDNKTFKVVINGLKGGHSGADIHLELANANILMSRILDALNEQTTLKLVALSGGAKDNVITRESEAIFNVTNKDVSKVKQIVEALQEVFNTEYEAQDPTIKVTVDEVNFEKHCIDEASTEAVIQFLHLMPHGVVAYSMQIPGLVETSLNVGVVKLEEDYLKLVVSIRSSVPSKRAYVLRKIEKVCEAVGAKCTITGAYPAWVYASESPLRDQAVAVYEAMYGHKPEIKAIHAGLECGFILEKLPHLDIIALGPNTYKIHSPEECASISSMARVYAYLIQLLETLK